MGIKRLALSFIIFSLFLAACDRTFRKDDDIGSMRDDTPYDGQEEDYRGDTLVKSDNEDTTSIINYESSIDTINSNRYD